MEIEKNENNHTLEGTNPPLVFWQAFLKAGEGNSPFLATCQLLSRRPRIQLCKLSLKNVYFWWQPLTNTITDFRRIKNPAHFQKSRQEFFFFFSNNMSVSFNCGNWLGVEKNWLGAKSHRFHNSEAKPMQHSLKFRQGKLSRGFTVLLYRPVLLNLGSSYITLDHLHYQTTALSLNKYLSQIIPGFFIWVLDFKTPRQLQVLVMQCVSRLIQNPTPFYTFLSKSLFQFYLLTLHH